MSSDLIENIKPFTFTHHAVRYFVQLRLLYTELYNYEYNYRIWPHEFGRVAEGAEWPPTHRP